MASPLKGYHSPLLNGTDTRIEQKPPQPGVLERLAAIEVRIKTLEEKGVGNDPGTSGTSTSPL